VVARDDPVRPGALDVEDPQLHVAEDLRQPREVVAHPVVAVKDGAVGPGCRALELDVGRTHREVDLDVALVGGADEAVVERLRRVQRFGVAQAGEVEVRDARRKLQNPRRSRSGRLT
jgi:hypothetical protein